MVATSALPEMTCHAPNPTFELHFIFSGEAVFTTSRHKPGTKSVWPVVQSTEINCGRAPATAPGPAGPGPNDSHRRHAELAVRLPRHVPAPLTVQLNRHRMRAHATIRDHGAAEPAPYADPRCVCKRSR